MGLFSYRQGFNPTSRVVCRPEAGPLLLPPDPLPLRHDRPSLATFIRK